MRYCNNGKYKQPDQAQQACRGGSIDALLAIRVLLIHDEWYKYKTLIQQITMKVCADVLDYPIGKRRPLFNRGQQKLDWLG